MQQYKPGSYTKSDLKAHLVWTSKDQKQILLGKVAIRARDILRQVAAENHIKIQSGKISCYYVHLFISYNPYQSISKLVQYLKGTSSRILFQEFPHIHKQLLGGNFWARGYFVGSYGTINDEMINKYLREQHENHPHGRLQGDFD